MKVLAYIIVVLTRKSEHYAFRLYRLQEYSIYFVK